MSKWWLRVDFDEEVRQLPKGHLRALIYSTVLAVGYADHVLGAEFGFSIFYLLPVIIATRNLGRNTGFFISGLCALLAFGMDYLHGVHGSNPLALYWHTFMRFTLFFITVMIFDGWEKEKENARTDTLTLIANRLAINEYGDLEIKRCLGNFFLPIFYNKIMCQYFSLRLHYLSFDQILAQKPFYTPQSRLQPENKLPEKIITWSLKGS